MKVLLTDRAWPDDGIERAVVETAGFEFVFGPADPAPPEAIVELVREHQPDAIMTCWAVVNASAIAASSSLRIIARVGVGLDNIAVDEATARNIWVTNVPDYCIEEVSDHAVGMLLDFTRGLSAFDRDVRLGCWHPAAARLRRLSALTCGIVGYGRIGQLTVRKLKGFGCRLLVHSRSASGAEEGFDFVTLTELFGQSDIVILHLPLDDSTRHLIGKRNIGMFKPGSFLINVSRGAVVETDAIVEALATGQLAGVGFDVFETEPVVPKALLEHTRSIFTPHVAFSSDKSLIELRTRAAEEVVRVLKGEMPREPRNRIEISSLGT